MRIAEVLSQKGDFVATIPPGATLHEVVSALARHRVGALVVVEGDAICGIISERDVVGAIDRFGPKILDAELRMAMSAEVRTCAPGDTVEELARTMTEHRIRHVPVVDEGRLVGIVSIGDVVKSRLDQLERSRSELEQYITAR